jgi:hypothetical protein
MMPPLARVEHCTGSRLRLRFPEGRRDAAFFSGLAGTLSLDPGVEAVEPRPATASLLIHHRGDPEGILARATEQGLFRLADDPPARRSLAEAAVGATTGFDQRLRRLSGGGVDLDTLLFLALVGLAVSQLVRGQFMAPAASLLWYAIGLIKKDDPP